MVNEIMEELFEEIDWQELENIAYQSKLGKSLKNTLRKFEKEELFDFGNYMMNILLELRLILERS